MENMTENERAIVAFLREAKPYEKIVISKDGKGNPDTYIITREQKVILTRISLK